MIHGGHKQQGATLVVSLIMLALITLLVTTAFTMSNVGMQSVGNMQNREEAIAAANKAIEQVMSSPFTNAPTAESIDVDIDNDTDTDYSVDFEAPSCVSATLVPTATVPPSSITLANPVFTAPSGHFQTVWELNASVADERGGASVRVRQGVRVLLSESQVEDVCS